MVGLVDVVWIGGCVVVRVSSAAMVNWLAQKDQHLIRQLTDIVLEESNNARGSGTLFQALQWASTTMAMDNVEYADKMFFVIADYWLVVRFMVGLLTSISLSLRLISLS